jgi:hypothetical protein
MRRSKEYIFQLCQTTGRRSSPFHEFEKNIETAFAKVCSEMGVEFERKSRGHMVVH